MVSDENVKCDVNLELEASRVSRILRSLHFILIGTENWAASKDSIEFTGLGDLLGMLGERFQDAADGVEYVRLESTTSATAARGPNHCSHCNPPAYEAVQKNVKGK